MRIREYCSALLQLNSIEPAISRCDCIHFYCFIKSDNISLGRFQKGHWHIWECWRKKTEVKWLVFLRNLDWEQELGLTIAISLPGNLYLCIYLYYLYIYILYILKCVGLPVCMRDGGILGMALKGNRLWKVWRLEDT